MIYALLVAHFVADFICQSDWMALNKSKRWDALALHVAVYTVVLAVFVVALTDDRGSYFLFCYINAAAHFVQDAVTSRINARLWQAEQRHWFFVGIGADQLLHYITLFATAEWLLR